MESTRILVLGTRNHKKGVEMASLVAPLGIAVHTLDRYPHAVEVEETGENFAANAILKATQQARALGHWVLADDSGLAVDALGGRPGVYSARYSGPAATDASNNALLLEELAGLPAEKRLAHYVCHFALADPAGNLRGESHGECHGRIRTHAEGQHGFGYDPLFEVVEYHRTFGELSPAVKSMISHRARAARALLPLLKMLR